MCWLLLLSVAPAFKNDKNLNSQRPKIIINEKATLPGVGVTVSKNLIAQKEKSQPLNLFLSLSEWH